MTPSDKIISLSRLFKDENNNRQIEFSYPYISPLPSFEKSWACNSENMVEYCLSLSNKWNVCERFIDMIKLHTKERK